MLLLKEKTMIALDVKAVKLIEREERTGLTRAYVIETTHEELGVEEI
ncbi:MAG: hypothetical protein ACLKAK_06910 [Alkaliphilus sp.]